MVHTTVTSGRESTPKAADALLCGAINEDGTDCLAPAHEEAPINLCAEHLIAAAAWVNENDESTRPREMCPLCSERELRVDPAGGGMCGRCGYQTADFAGRARLTPAEEDELAPRAYGRRPVNVVYYIRFGDRIKIGTSSNVRQRLQNLPHDEVLAFERGGIQVEAARHAQFAAHRIGRSEWFEINDPLLGHIASLSDGESPWEIYRRVTTRRISPNA